MKKRYSLALQQLFFLLMIFLSANFSGQIAIGQINKDSTETNPQGSIDMNSVNRKSVFPLVLPSNSPTNFKNFQPSISNPAPGSFIYDDAADCVRYYKKTNVWSDCLGVTNQADLVANCLINGFSGYFNQGQAVVNGEFTVTLTNNSFSTATVALQTSDLVLSGVNGLIVSGVSSSSITLASGQSELITYSITGIPASLGTLTGSWTKLALHCTNTIPVINNAVVGTLNCLSSSAPIATRGETYTANGQLISYTGSNGASYSTQIIPSTGVTGLTMTINGGNTANGSGTLAVSISGIPTGFGNALFAINFGGKTCTFTIPVEEIILVNQKISDQTIGQDVSAILIYSATPSIDPYNGWNSTTNRYTVPFNGKYRVEINQPYKVNVTNDVAMATSIQPAPPYTLGTGSVQNNNNPLVFSGNQTASLSVAAQIYVNLRTCLGCTNASAAYTWFANGTIKIVRVP